MQRAVGGKNLTAMHRREAVVQRHVGREGQAELVAVAPKPFLHAVRQAGKAPKCVLRSQDDQK